MTPEERIAQLAAQRGGVATVPRVRRPSVEPKTAPEPSKPARPNGFNICLPQSWQRIGDTWGNRERRTRLERLETYLAAGVIVRYLGRREWHREQPESSTGWVRIVHRDGYGFELRRNWQDHTRFHSSPIETYRRNEPASITTNASRPLGAIARDIENRLIDNGLREAYEQSQSVKQDDKVERRKRFGAIVLAARAFGGRVLPRRRWKSDGYPMAELGCGVAEIGYGFDDSRQLELSLRVDLATARAIGSIFNT